MSIIYNFEIYHPGNNSVNSYSNNVIVTIEFDGCDDFAQTMQNALEEYFPGSTITLNEEVKL